MTINGLIAAAFTPMTPDGAVNLALIPQQADFLRRNGIAGVFICGTTGESMSLTLDERKQVAEAWADCCDENLRLLVHVGHDCLAYARQLAEHAQQIQAAAIGALAPVFFKAANLEILVEICGQIAAAASKTPFYYYHIPSMTGLDMPMQPFLHLAAARIPNLAGIKFSAENLHDFGRCVDYQDHRFDMFFGCDEIMTSALMVGATGFIGSFYNFMAPLFNEIIRAFFDGDVARTQALQRQVRDFNDVFERNGGNAATGKAIMALIGLDCGPARLPMRTLDAGPLRLLNEDLHNIDFYDYSST